MSTRLTGRPLQVKLGDLAKYLTAITVVFSKLISIRDVAQQLTKASSELADAEGCQLRDICHQHTQGL